MANIITKQDMTGKLRKREGNWCIERLEEGNRWFYYELLPDDAVYCLSADEGREATFCMLDFGGRPWAKLLDQELEQVDEISDAEIDAASKKLLDNNLYTEWSEILAFKKGARWYREQLKSRK
jgi:hypothetical protein